MLENLWPFLVALAAAVNFTIAPVQECFVRELSIRAYESSGPTGVSTRMTPLDGLLGLHDGDVITVTSTVTGSFTGELVFTSPETFMVRSESDYETKLFDNDSRFYYVLADLPEGRNTFRINGSEDVRLAITPRLPVAGSSASLTVEICGKPR